MRNTLDDSGRGDLAVHACASPRAVALAMGVLVTLAAGVASAQTVPLVGVQADASPADVVTLRDGTVLRGHVATLRPEQSVTLALFDGTVREIPWADIASTSGPAFRDTPAPVQVNVNLRVPESAPTSPVPPSTVLHPGADRVALRIESTGDTLDVAPLGSDPTRTLCQTPCTLYVAPGERFRFRTTYEIPAIYQYSARGRPQPNAVSTAHEILAPPVGAMRVSVRPPDFGLGVGSLVLALMGGGAAMMGTMVMLIGTWSGDCTSSHRTGAMPSIEPCLLGGGITAAVGLGMVATGVLLFRQSQSGVGSTEMVPAGSFTLGAAPIPGGGAVAGALVF